MRVTWSGMVASTSGRVGKDGRKTEYRVDLYDTGEASCTCRSFLFQGLNNPDLRPEERTRFRCKHILLAYARVGQEVPPTGNPAPTSDPALPPTAAPGLQGPPSGLEPELDPFLADFADDDLESLPQTR